MFELIQAFWEKILEPYFKKDSAAKLKLQENIGSPGSSPFFGGQAPLVPTTPENQIGLPVKTVIGNAYPVINTPVPAPSGVTSSSSLVTTIISRPTICVQNASSVISDADLSLAVNAIQVQLDRDFSPHWGMSATLKILPRGQPVPGYDWLVSVMDHSDQAGALGYHDLTAQGMPLAKIFAADDLKYNLSWTVTLSHEILEMIVDPWISLCSFNQTSNTGGTLYAYECCDAVEDDAMGYKINDVLVSNFQTPAWWEAFRQPNSTKFDFMGKINSPFALGKGGYISTFQIPTSTGWSQVYAEMEPSVRLQRKLLNEGSRTNRRDRVRGKQV